MSHGQRREVSARLRAWLRDGRDCVLATVTSSDSSAPRGLGAQLAIADGREWTGGLSGGCAEVAVLDAARQLVHASSSRRTARTLSMRKDTLTGTGPMCGATLGVLVERVDEELVAHLEAIAHNQASGTSTVAVRTYRQAGATLADGAVLLERESLSTAAGDVEPTPPESVSTAAGDVQSAPSEAMVTWEDGDAGAALHEVLTPPIRIVACGGGDVAIELVRIARTAGMRTVLIDPRPAFRAHTVAAAAPDTTHTAWPGPALAGELALGPLDACVATAHDDRIDLPFLELALASPALYVGAVGSRATQHRRRAQLEQGVGVEAAARLHGPAGLDLGGSSAGEIALSIVAEVLACACGRDAAPLRAGAGSIRER